MIDQTEFVRLFYEVLVEHDLRRNRIWFDEVSVQSRVYPYRPGVYAIWLPGFGHVEDRCLYVGKSDHDVRGRLLEQLRGSDNDWLSWYLDSYYSQLEFSVRYPINGAVAEALEMVMIRRLKPECNEHANRRPARMHPIARTFATKGGLPTMPRTGRDLELAT